MSTEKSYQDLDVVIPTRDRPEQLSATLEALVRQSFREFGVIVVDDDSTANVEAMVPQRLREALGIRFIRNETSLGAGPARNRGVAASTARYVVFIDDDCLAGPELIGAHFRALTRADEPVVSLGPILAMPGPRPPVWAHWDAHHLERNYNRLATGEDSPQWNNLFTGNVGLRRTDFLAVGAFDESFSRGEDVELGYRLARYGCRFVFDSTALVRHDNQRSLRSWRAVVAAEAISDIAMHQRNPESDRLATVAHNLASRHWATRWVRRTFGGPISGRLAIAAAMTAGVVFHAVRLDSLAFNAFSIVSDLTYWRTLQAALPPDARVEPRTPIGVG